MASLRLQLAILAACAWFPTDAPAQQVPVWQPYRTITPHIVPQPVGPPSYVTSVVDVPIDVISESELEEMCVPCGEPLLGQSVPQYFTAPVYSNAPFGDPVLAPLADAPVWNWRLLPDDLIWHSYWAGTKEPRISGTLFEEIQDDVTLFDVTFGGRTSVLRYGTVSQGRPEGWELQLESAAMLRLNLDEDWDLEAVDFRIGVPLIYGQERSQWKFAYYHLSSHLGDEIVLRGAKSITDRINFSRDVLVVAYSLFPVPALRLYSEAGWAFYADEGTDPWEFQFGADYAQPGPTGCRGTPFFAINGQLREEVDFGGNLVVQGGWLWRGKGGKILRTGLHYYNGKSNQFQFFDQFEQQIGFGLWHEY